MANYRTSVTCMGHPHPHAAMAQNYSSTSQTNRRRNDQSLGRRDKSDGRYEVNRTSAPQQINSLSFQNQNMVNLAHQQNQNQSFNQGGHDLSRIMDGQMHRELKDSMICGICLEIPIDPMECENCRGLFCKECITKW